MCGGKGSLRTGLSKEGRVPSLYHPTQTSTLLPVASISVGMYFWW